jgi:hypothetical protein
MVAHNLEIFARVQYVRDSQFYFKTLQPYNVIVHECNECYNNTIGDTDDKDIYTNKAKPKLVYYVFTIGIISFF